MDAKKIRLDGVVGLDITVESVTKQLPEDTQTPLDIGIKSGGGSVVEGFAIFNLLSAYPGHKRIVIDLAASIASVITMAGDHVCMYDHTSMLMIHRPTAGAQGHSDDLRQTAELLDQTQSQLVQIYADKTGLALDEINRMVDAETWMYADQAFELGFIDEILTNTRSLKAMRNELVEESEKCLQAYAGLFEMANMTAKIEEQFPSLDSCKSVRDVERYLRASGHSRKEAVGIVAKVLAVANVEETGEATGESVEVVVAAADSSASVDADTAADNLVEAQTLVQVDAKAEVTEILNLLNRYSSKFDK